MTRVLLTPIWSLYGRSGGSVSDHPTDGDLILPKERKAQRTKRAPRCKRFGGPDHPAEMIDKHNAGIALVILENSV
jgi:hypothetical protein